jgi:hypothetical protein
MQTNLSFGSGLWEDDGTTVVMKDPKELNLDNNKLTFVNDPVNSQDAVNLRYLQAHLGDSNLWEINGSSDMAMKTATDLQMSTKDIHSRGWFGSSSANHIDFTTSNKLGIILSSVSHSIASISDGDADNDKFVTQGYVDDAILWEIDTDSTQLKIASIIDMQTKKIIGVVDPTSDQDAATKKYVDDKEAEIIQDGGAGNYNAYWADGDIVTITTAATPTYLNLKNVPEGKTGQVRVTQGASGSYTLSLIIYSGDATGTLTQKVFGIYTTIDVTPGNVTKIIYQRFGTDVDISYIYEH